MKFPDEVQAEVAFVREHTPTLSMKYRWLRRLDAATQSVRVEFRKPAARRDKDDVLLALVSLAAWCQIAAENLRLCPRTGEGQPEDKIT